MAKKKRRADGRMEIKRKMPDGKVRHFLGQTAKECEDKYRQALVDFNARQEKQAAGPMFEALADEWWEAVNGTLSPNTRHSYQYILPKIKASFHGCRTSEITPNQVTLWLDGLARAGKARKTAANYRIVLSDILQYGHERYNIPANNAKTVTLPRGMQQTRRRMPSEEQMEIILNNYQSDWACEIYYIFAFTGLRLGELLALRWADLDPAAQTIRVERSVYWSHGTQASLKRPKTEAGDRVIPYLPQVQAVLEPKRGPADHYVIHGPRSTGEKPMTCTSYTGMLKHARKLGISSTPHQLRHAFATLCCEAEISPRTAGAIFGWEDPSRMEDIYAEIRRAKIQSAGQALSKAHY